MDLKYPTDEDGFGQVTPHNELLDYMRKYGLIVIEHLAPSEQKESITALYSEIGKTPTSVSGDPKTWDTENFQNPSSPFLSTKPAVSKQAFMNRVNPELVKAFKVLYGTNDLYTTVDFWGFKRGVWDGNQFRFEWHLKPLKPHWDTDVMTYSKSNQRLYQALTALKTNNVLTGSFSCVPGSHTKLDEYIKFCKENKLQINKYANQKFKPFRKLQNIYLRAGHCVIWDRGLVHANTSSTQEPRLTQYVRMNPISHEHFDDKSVVKFWKDVKNAPIKENLCKWFIDYSQVLEYFGIRYTPRNTPTPSHFIVRINNPGVFDSFGLEEKKSNMEEKTQVNKKSKTGKKGLIPFLGPDDPIPCLIPANQFDSADIQVICFDMDKTLYDRTNRGNGRLRKDAIQVLTALRIDGYKLVLWTSATRRNTKNFINLVGIFHQTLTRDEICVNDELGDKKWSTIKPEQKVLASFPGLNPKHLLMVDDSYNKLRYNTCAMYIIDEMKPGPDTALRDLLRILAPNEWAKLYGN